MGFLSSVVKGATRAAAAYSTGGWSELVNAGINVANSFGSDGSRSRMDDYNTMQQQAQISREDIPLRVQAYKDAGIHPVFGMSGQQYTPSAVSSPSSGPSSGSHLAAAGQNISRAAAAFSSAEERTIQKAQTTLGLEKMKLENDLLRAQITTISRPTNPPIPGALTVHNMPGQGDSGLSGFDISGGSDASSSTSRNGNVAVVPSADVKNRIEDMIIPEVQWYLRQVTAPKIPGYTYNPFTSELVPDSKSVIRKILDNTTLSNRTWGRSSKSGPYIWNR